MKKFIFLMTLLSASVAVLRAAPSGPFDEYIPTQKASESMAPVRGNGFLLRPILEGKKVAVKLWIENEEKGEGTLYTNMIKEGYNAWFRHAVAAIYEQGRAAEFADVLPYLERGAHISVSKAQQPEIHPEEKEGTPKQYPAVPYVNVWKDFDTLSKHCDGGETNGCQHANGIELTKALEDSEKQNNLIHEIGHNLGFVDQYMFARKQAHPIFTSYDFTHSIMYRSAQGLQCGDVDGIINLIDITLGLKRNNGKAWKSFCPDSEETFVGGMSSHANVYVFTRDGLQIMLDKYDKGELISRQVLDYVTEPFDVWELLQPVAVKEYDGAGRAAHLIGKNGEDIYYTYWQNYEKMEQLVVKDGKAVYLQLAEAFLNDGFMSYYITKYFRAGKKLGRLRGQYGHTLRAVSYEEREMAGGKTFEMILSFEQNSKKVNVHFDGNFGSSVMTPRVPPCHSEEELMEKIKSTTEDWLSRAKKWAEGWMDNINPCQQGKGFCKEKTVN